MTVTTLVGTIQPSVRAQPVAPPVPEASRQLDPIVARVRRKHPTATEAVVRRCVEEAADHFDEAGVDAYLTILIERRSALAVKAALPAETNRHRQAG